MKRITIVAFFFGIAVILVSLCTLLAVNLLQYQSNLSDLYHVTILLRYDYDRLSDNEIPKSGMAQRKRKFKLLVDKRLNLNDKRYTACWDAYDILDGYYDPFQVWYHLSWCEMQLGWDSLPSNAGYETYAEEYIASYYD